MDILTLARLQFAAVTIYHFFFVPLTLGLGIIVATMETIYVVTGQPVYKKMTKFWGKLFVINFAMGVVTGIVQEFQFGMNWSEYSRYVGDIFGAPLAVEALLAFFIESTFLGVWLFGWERLSPKVHAAAIWLVAIAANISAFFILVANSFMQQPVGFTINAEAGRAEMTNFLHVIFNPNIWSQYPHTVAAGLTTGAFFVMGISIYHLLRKNETDLFRRSFQIAAMVAAAGVLIVGMIGHTQTQHIVEIQPMKMAAAEALWDTEESASFSLFTIGNEAAREDIFSIRIPGLLSLLAYNQLDAEVKGINDLQAEYELEFGPGDYVPPVAVTYWSFRLMVGAGMLMILFALYALFLIMSETVAEPPRLARFFVPAMILPFVGTATGWILTEVGRSPWAVFGLLKLEDSVSPNVTAGMLLTTLFGYLLIYGALIVADVYLMTKYAKAGPEPLVLPDPEQEPGLVSPS